MTASALAFQGTTFDIVDRNGQPWLRAHQIGVALDYKRSDIIAKLYRANAAEFTDSMTAVVKLPPFTPVPTGESLWAFLVFLLWAR